MSVECPSHLPIPFFAWEGELSPPPIFIGGNVNIREKARVAKGIIKALIDGRYIVECPCCQAKHKSESVNFFYGDDFNDHAQEWYDGHVTEFRERRKELTEQSKRMKKRSNTGAIAVNLGFLWEKLAPSLDGFPFSMNDIRFLGDPIDMVIFEGLSKGKVNRILFGDIKSGGARLTQRQKSIQNLVEKNKISMEVY